MLETAGGRSSWGASKNKGSVLRSYESHESACALGTNIENWIGRGWLAVVDGRGDGDEG